MKDRNENRPGYKKTKLGWIPEEWNSTVLRDICGQPLSGFSVNGFKRPATQGEKGVLKLSCIQNGRFVPNQNKFVDNDGVALLKTSVRKNTILISRSNNDDLVGAVCFVDRDYPDLFLPDLLWEVSSKSKKNVHLRWLTYLLASQPFRTRILARANGTSGTMKKITKPSFLGIRILFPPLPEQKKIAEILSSWDAAIEQTRRWIDAKKRRKKGLMQQLLTGKIRLAASAPHNGWKSIRAGDLFKVRSKKNHGHLPVLSVTQDVGVVERDSLERKIESSKTNTNSYKLVEPGDFVISLRSFQGGLEYSNIRGVVSPAYHVIHPSREISPLFYKYYFKSYDFIGHLAVAVIGIRDGKQVSSGDFSFMHLPYPPIDEQVAIAAVLQTADDEINQLEAKLKALEKQKRGLMQKLLTGEIRVAA